VTRALFLWVPKTAGSSIWAAIKASGETYQELCYPNHIDQYQPEPRFTTWGHCHVGTLIEAGRCRVFCPLTGAFTFAFVRNPWDRLVSLFHYESQKRNLNPDGFRNYIRMVTRGAIDPIGAYNEQGHSKANRQLDWLRWGDRWLPDFVGRFENLEADWRTVCGELGIDAPLPHHNASNHDHYSTYYTDALARRVAVRFAEEIDMFHYTFQESPL